MSDEVHGDVVGDDLVDKVGVVNGPARLGLAEGLAELALGRRVLPRLPDVGGELGVDVVGELVLELLLEGPCMQLVEADLLLGLLGRCVWAIEGLVWLVCFLCLVLGLGLGLCGRLFRVHPRAGLGEVVGVFERGRPVACVVRLEHEEQRQTCQREHERLLEGEHGEGLGVRSAAADGDAVLCRGECVAAAARRVSVWLSGCLAVWLFRSFALSWLAGQELGLSVAACRLPRVTAMCCPSCPHARTQLDDGRRRETKDSAGKTGAQLRGLLGNAWPRLFFKGSLRLGCRGCLTPERASCNAYCVDT